MSVETREGLLLRVYVGEQDKHEGAPLYKALVHLLRERGVRGATALRGLYGYGRGRALHSARALDLSADLPIVVEAVDEDATIEGVLPDVVAMAGGALVTTEGVRVHGPHRRGSKPGLAKE